MNEQQFRDGLETVFNATQFKAGDKVEVNGNKEAVVIGPSDVNGMYDIRMWQGNRHVGDITVDARSIKKRE